MKTQTVSRETTWQDKLDELKAERSALMSSPGISSEKFHAIDRVENEMRIIKKELALGYRPPPSAPVYSNKGYWKDWINVFATGLWRYNSASNPQIIFLEPKGKTDLKDGYYAYAYRFEDNRVACTFTGKTTTNALAHSYLADGGDVYAAGMMEVKDQTVISIDSASGHYQPDPKIRLTEKCSEEITSNKSLTYVRKKLASLGYGAESTIKTLPFRHPGLEKEKIECQSLQYPFGNGFR